MNSFESQPRGKKDISFNVSFFFFPQGQLSRNLKTALLSNYHFHTETIIPRLWYVSNVKQETKKVSYWSFNKWCTSLVTESFNHFEAELGETINS